MPALTNAPKQKTAQPLFIGLQSYTEAQAENFYGRDDEIDRLTNLIKNNALTIVFGKSGTGKTSLLNAGVFSKASKKLLFAVQDPVAVPGRQSGPGDTNKRNIISRN